MTPEERELLTRFLQDLTQASPGPKDPEAARLISDAVNANPDAPYLLVQHTILSDQALRAAQARIADLESQLRAAQPQATSFLGGARPGWSQPQGPATAVPPNGPPPQAPYYPEPYASPGPFSPGGGLGSFLRNAGTTAAGVAGGEMLFQGLSGLFGGHHGMFGGGGGMFGGGGGYAVPEENVTVNNYYDDDDHDRDDSWDESSYDDDTGSSDI